MRKSGLMKLSVFIGILLVINVSFLTFAFAGTVKSLTLEEDWRLTEPLDINAGSGNVIIIDGQNKYTIYEMNTLANFINCSGIVRLKDVRVINSGATPADGSLAELSKAAWSVASVAAPAKDATAITMPAAEGFTVAIKSSSNAGVIGLDGTITPPEVQQTVNLVFTLSGNGGEADTGSIPVVVPARTANTSSGSGNNGGGGGGGGGQVPDTTAASVSDGSTIVPDTTVSEGTAQVVVQNSQVASAFEKAKVDETGTKTVTVEVGEVAGASYYSAQLPAEIFRNGEANRLIEIKTPSASAVLPTNMLESISAGARNIALTIGAADTAGLPAEVREEIGGRPVIDINLSIDGSRIAWSNDSTPVSVSIPYTPKAGEDPDNIVVWYINGEGKAHMVNSGRYNPETGRVTFEINHFSKYAVSYVQKSFDDTRDTWGRKEIEFLAVRGIINGKSTSSFSPREKITRADFAKLLMAVINKKSAAKGSLTDISEIDYFYKEVMAANTLGIINGTGGGKFAPREYITRQDMMVMIDRAMKAAGVELSKKADFASFSDTGSLADYARDSAAKLVAAGIIQGSDGKLRPADNLTREETARILYLVYMKLY